jgi:hypothetical protein
LGQLRTQFRLIFDKRAQLSTNEEIGLKPAGSGKSKKKLEARVGIEPTYKGFADLSLTTWVPRLIAGWKKPRGRGTLPLNLERETGVEPATSTLARSRSTTELLPLGESDYKQRDNLAAMTRLHGTVSM